MVAYSDQTSRYLVQVEHEGRRLVIGFVAQYRSQGRCYPAYWRAMVYRPEEVGTDWLRHPYPHDLEGQPIAFGTRKGAAARLEQVAIEALVAANG